jgi:hypothetical protein
MAWRHSFDSGGQTRLRVAYTAMCWQSGRSHYTVTEPRSIVWPAHYCAIRSLLCRNERVAGGVMVCVIPRDVAVYLCEYF